MSEKEMKSFKQEASAEVMDAVSGGNDRPSGIACPQCDGFIPVTMQQVQTSSSIACPHCGYRLDIGTQNIAIEPLRKNRQ